MSSTNKTPNYDLSQYVGTDKPTYLGDYNGDMLKIDTQMKENNDAATAAQTSAGEALAKATQAQNDVSGLDTRVDTAEQNITQLQNTVTAQGQSITSANSKADTANENALSALNKISENKWTGFTNMTPGTNVNPTGGYEFKVNQNLFLNLLYFSGFAGTAASLPSGSTIFTLPANVKRPTATRNIGSIGFRVNPDGKASALTGTLDTDGNFKCDDHITGGTVLYIQSSLCTDGWY